MPSIPAMKEVLGDDAILQMMGGDYAKMGKAYERVVAKFSALAEAETCWPMEWFPEHLPTESAPGHAIDFYLQHLADPLCFDGGQWPAPDGSEVPKEDLLVFSDSYGFTKEILEQAPPGRIGIQNVQTKPASSYDEKTIQKLVNMHPWTMIVFAISIDPPASNSIADVHKQQDAVAKMFLWILKCLGDDATRCGRLCVLTCDTMAQEREIHEEQGIGLITNATIFGMCNTARTELPTIPIQYIDTEWSLRSENTKYLVAEMFRIQSFGHNNTRILNRGRYVQRKVHCKQYELCPMMQLPETGVIAITGGNGALGLVMGGWLLRKAKEQGGKKFSIKFLSRSMKVSDQNMPNWKEIESMAAELGITVEHAKCDCSSQPSVEEFIKADSPNIVGMIHSAGILQDSMLFNQTWEKFDAVWDSKSRAAFYIHDAFERYENPGLQFFWVFSSGAVYGNMGQLNYSASNAWLDALARHRRALGKPCMAPQWGAWGEVGMAANLDDASRRRMTNSPMPPFTNAEGLYGLECLLRTGLAYGEVHKINTQLYFGMVQGDDEAIQCHMRNLTSDVIPVPPGDPQKNSYTTITYTVRKQAHHLSNGLNFQHFHPKATERLAYERD